MYDLGPLVLPRPQTTKEAKKNPRSKLLIYPGLVFSSMLYIRYGYMSTQSDTICITASTSQTKVRDMWCCVRIRTMDVLGRCARKVQTGRAMEDRSWE